MYNKVQKGVSIDFLIEWAVIEIFAIFFTFFLTYGILFYKGVV